MPERSAWWLALVGAGGAVFGALVTGGFNYLGHQHDLDAKMIELSVGILRAEPTPETTPLREWAIDVIDKRANFKFNEKQRSALVKKSLPFVPIFIWGKDEWGKGEWGKGENPPGENVPPLPKVQPIPR